MRIASDGTPISSSVSSVGSDGSTQNFGIYRGTVMRSVYPDDANNSSGQRMEYVVRVMGQDYSNAINLREAGGRHNYKERVRQHAQKDASGRGLDRSRPENLDGENVFVMFVGGHSDVPLIIGGDRHSLQKKQIKRADGIFDVEEFNGVEVLIDQDSNLIFSQVGRKDPQDNIKNQDAVGSFIKISGVTGDIELGRKRAATEPLVLGNVMVAFASAVFDAILNAPSIGTSAMGPVFLDPGVRAALVAAKQQFITTAATNIISQFAFTDRGDA